mmetsp:Transcript_32376/g.66173  ORF Transcript_32376/g.66173 Transcript_32376/m.66173 type:complete len:304 (+) Transcript_32376:179-1090(+)
MYTKCPIMTLLFSFLHVHSFKLVHVEIFNIDSLIGIHVHLRRLIFFFRGGNFLREGEIVHSHDHLHHLHHPLRVLLRVRDRKSSVEQGHVVQQPGGVDGLFLSRKGVVLLVRTSLQELLDEGVAGVDLQDPHGAHHHVVLAVLERLGAHDSLHVGGVAVFAAADDGGGLAQSLGNGNAHDLGSVQLVQPLGQGLELLLVGLFAPLHHVLVLILEFDALLTDGDKLLAVEFPEGVGHVLVDRVGEVQDLHVLLEELVHEMAGFHVLNLRAGEDVDVVLPFLHPLNVGRERYIVVLAFSLTGLES